MMKTGTVYVLAALAEIGGCYAFWMWARLGKSAIWLAPGVMLPVAFAWLLAQVPAEAAGRAYAAYGGVYIIASIGWLWTVERFQPDRWDLIGATLCLVGATVILAGPR